MILYVGGTGIAGSAAVAELCRRSNRVRCLVRTTSDLSRLKGQNVELVYGDVRDRSALAKAVAGADTVISSFATNIAKERRVAALWEADYEGNLSLIKLAQAAGLKKFVFVSYWGLAKFADFEHGKIKKLVEDLLAVSALDYTVLRVTTLATDLSLLLGARLQRKGRAPVVMQRHEKVRPILPEDLARCIADAVDNPRASRKIIEVAGEEEYTFLELQELYCRAIGRRVRLVFIPPRIAMMIAACVDFATGNRYNARGLVSAFTGGSTCDIAAMRSVFGIRQGSFARHLEDFFRTGAVVPQQEQCMRNK